MTDEIYNEVTNRLHSVRESESPETNHIVSGADEVYDDVAPYRVNGHIDCTEVTPVGTENPKELRWYEQITVTSEGQTNTEWVRSQDLTVDSEKTYGIPTGAKQSDINDQLYRMQEDLDKVCLYADEYNEVTNPSGSNPSANGWYYNSAGTGQTPVYVLATETSVDNSHLPYYVRVAKISTDESKIINQQDGYIPTAGAVGRALGVNFEDSLTSTSTVKGLTANQGRILNEKKANKNGWYEQLVAGASLSVIGDDKDDKAQFFYRETGDSSATGGTEHAIEKGTTTIDVVKGKTVKFNQFVRNGNFATTDNWNAGSGVIFNVSNNVATVTASENNSRAIDQTIAFINGHKYYCACSIKSGDTNSKQFEISDNVIGTTGGVTTKQRVAGLVNWAYSSSGSLGVKDLASSDYQPFTIENVICIDLTVMDYPNIATTTPTVAEVEEWLANNVGKKDYYPYNTGSLISLKPKKLVSSGVNLYNPTTGTARVISGKQYKLTGTNPGAEYSDGTAITLSDGLFTASKDDIITISGGNFTDTFLYLVLNNNTSKTFEPYETNETDLSWIMDIPDPSDNTKKLFPYGLLKAGNICDEVTATKAIKRIGAVDLGSLSWIYDSATDHERFQASPPVPSKRISYGVLGNIICSKYETSEDVYVYAHTKDKIIGTHDGMFQVYDSSYIDAATFKTAMNGVMLYYELETPITVYFEEPDTHPMNYEVEPGGTEEFIKADVEEGEKEPTSTALTAEIIYPMDTLQTIRNIENNYMSKAAYISSSNSLVSAINGMSLGYTLAFDETTLLFSSSETVNTQSVEEPTETI